MAVRGRPKVERKKKGVTLSLSEECLRQIDEFADGRSRTITVEILVGRAWERRERRKQSQRVMEGLPTEPPVV